LRDEEIMVGQIGFHDKPGAEYLEGLAPDGLEIGYRVYEGFRRQGYALEAVRGLMSWAREKRPDTAFVVSISPDNVGS
jgi:RimJ/RimL family protein N-acetyltransferase